MIKIIKNKGFTLIELLVVIGIIGILASILLIDLKSTKQKANDARFSLESKQIALAMQLYYDKYGDWPNPNPQGNGNYAFPRRGNPPCFPGPNNDDYPCFVPEFYSKWDASYHGSYAEYSFQIYDKNGDKKPDCGIIFIDNSSAGFTYRIPLCITSVCGTDCGYKYP